jgi:hypothetical protein
MRDATFEKTPGLFFATCGVTPPPPSLLLCARKRQCFPETRQAHDITSGRLEIMIKGQRIFLHETFLNGLRMRYAWVRMENKVVSNGDRYVSIQADGVSLLEEYIKGKPWNPLNKIDNSDFF